MQSLLPQNQSFGQLLLRMEPPAKPELLRGCLTHGAVGVLCIYIGFKSDGSWLALATLPGCILLFSALAHFWSILRKGPTVLAFEHALILGKRVVEWKEVTQVDYRVLKTEGHHGAPTTYTHGWNFYMRDGSRRHFSVSMPKFVEYISPDTINAIIRANGFPIAPSNSH